MEIAWKGDLFKWIYLVDDGLMAVQDRHRTRPYLGGICLTLFCGYSALPFVPRIPVTTFERFQFTYGRLQTNPDDLVQRCLCAAPLAYYFSGFPLRTHYPPFFTSIALPDSNARRVLFLASHSRDNRSVFPNSLLSNHVSIQHTL